MSHDHDLDDSIEPQDISEQQINALLNELGITPQPPRVRPKTDWTVAELYNTPLPQPKWIVPELLPPGLASLAGRPKLGKSWLALHLAAAVARGRPFLGQALKAGPVLFVALEDPPRRLRDRLQVLDVPSDTRIEFSTEWRALNAQPSGLYDLQQCVAEMQPRLVVFDTLALALDMPVGNVSRALSALLAAGWVRRLPRQGRRVPYRLLS